MWQVQFFEPKPNRSEDEESRPWWRHAPHTAPTLPCFPAPAFSHFPNRSLAFKPSITLAPVHSHISEPYQQLKCLSMTENLSINQWFRDKVSVSLKRGVDFTNQLSEGRRGYNGHKGKDFQCFYLILPNLKNLSSLKKQLPRKHFSSQKRNRFPYWPKLQKLVL